MNIQSKVHQNFLIKAINSFFDITSLFKNVSLNKTVNIIEKTIYKEKLTNTKLSKNNLKKPIKDCCTKTVFL